MPTNLYGPNDNYDLKSSHVLPAMIRKFHEAKLNGHTPVKLWGTGSPMREFLHVDDLAQVVLLTLENTLDDYLYNIGAGVDLTIYKLAQLIQSIVGHEGEIIWDKSKPDGTPRKLLDSSKIMSVFPLNPRKLSQGIEETYTWYLQNYCE